MKKLLFFIGLSFMINAVNAQEKATTKIYCDKSQSSITYSMNHPLHSWDGVSNEINSVILADENRDSIFQVAVSVKIASFDSKNANRDSHAMEVTESLLYPSITFTSTSIQQTGSKLQLSGTLMFHNVSQPISFEVQKEKIKGKARFKGGFKVKMTEFNIEPPSLMGIATDDEIVISFDVLY